jgi:hypothetical protein
VCCVCVRYYFAGLQLQIRHLVGVRLLRNDTCGMINYAKLLYCTEYCMCTLVHRSAGHKSGVKSVLT